MKFTDGLITVQDKVQALLEDYPMLRDSDKKLWLAYMVKCPGLRITMKAASNPYESFKRLLLDDSTPTMETVTRARRKIQEKNPALRGEGYKTRHDESENVKAWSRT